MRFGGEWCSIDSDSEGVWRMISPSSIPYTFPSLRIAVAPRIRHRRVSGGGTHVGSRDVLVGRTNCGAHIDAIDRRVAHAKRVDLIFCVEFLLDGWCRDAVGVRLMHGLDVGGI